MAKLWITRYRVKPIGDCDNIFPLDMLRRDGSRPTTQEDVGALSYSLLGSQEMWKKGATIQLSHIEHGNKTWEPSYERWKSFGWEVVEVNPSEQGL